MKIETKTKFSLKCLIFIIILTSSYLNAQLICSRPPLQASASQPSTCVRQLLDDLSPVSPNDRTLYVNVNLFVMVPVHANSLTSVWTNTLDPSLLADATAFINTANYIISHNPAIPQLTTAACTNTTFTDPKIRFVLKNFSYIHDDNGYFDVLDLVNGIFGWNYHDKTAINVFFGAQSTTTLTTIGSNTYITSTYDPLNAQIGMPLVFPYLSDISSIQINPMFHYTLTSTSRYDNIRAYGDVFVHEAAHILGLNHAIEATTTNSACCNAKESSFIQPTFGCCNYQECGDYAEEHFPCSSSVPSTCVIQIPQQSCGTPGGSDNMMSRNSGCNRYLSPQQVGVMHFNLTTVLKGFLNASSYTAATTVNTAFDYNVTSNETWASDRYMKGNITVKANKSLTIKCGVAMTHDSKIIVEQGALLTIDGGTITNISGRLWEGIYLIGKPNLAQIVYNSSNTLGVLYQGMLRIKNGGTISQAKVGVRNYLNSGSNSGGLIFAQNANFINNMKDVEMIGANLIGSAPIQSASWFYNCNFKTTGVIGAIIGSTVSAYAPQTHVNLIRVSGVKIMGCVFQYTANPSSTIGDGITSMDASYIVDKNGSTPCVFENLGKGIYVNNINPLKIPLISNSKFINNVFGAYFMNTNYIVFQTNTVQPGYAAGIYLNNSKYYKIKNNLFYQPVSNPAGPGICAFKSKDGAHEIYRNKFCRLSIGINCMDNNGNASNPLDGLKMNCNRFDSIPNDYDIALTYTSGLTLPLVNKTQGEILTSATATNVVRNVYGAVCNGNQNKWYIYSGSSVTINHGSNTNSLTAITQPTASGCKSSYLNVVNKNINLNYPSDCLPSPPSAGGTSTISSNRLSSMNDYLSALKYEETLGAKNDFEIQATVASKLNIFLTDTLNQDLDSVANILENNHGEMLDADLQTIFAYMSKGEYEHAQTLVNALDHRSDWATLLTKLITLEQDTVNGIFNLGAEDRSFFTGYASDDDKDGQALAQALLKSWDGIEYTEPLAVPEETTGARRMSPASQKNTGLTESESAIKVYPNPAQTGLNIYYSSLSEGPVKIELRDLLGRLIYTNFINNNRSTQYISMDQLNSGMYLLILTKGNTTIHKEKIIKE